MKKSRFLSVYMVIISVLLTLGCLLPSVTARAEGETVTVTSSNFSTYFDDEGNLKSGSFDTLKFSGEFTSMPVSKIVINRSVKLSSDDSYFENVVFEIAADNVSLDGLNIKNSQNGIIINDAENVTLTNNTLEVTTDDKSDGYAVEAYNAGGLKMSRNTINYTGASTGVTYNKGLYIHGEIKSDVLVSDNIFNLNIPSLATGWNENPPGSGNWEMDEMSAGIVIEEEETSSSNITFKSNNITVKYTNVAGSYDTIYAVRIKKNSGIVNVSDNVLVANGVSYTYGFSVSAESLTMDKNDITVISDGMYACGIDLSEHGNYTDCVIKNNKINAKADNTVYGIYSEENEYTGNEPEFTSNEMTLKANYCIGIDLMSDSAPSKGFNIGSNTIIAEGVYLSGIAVRVNGKCGIKDNIIEASSVNSDAVPDYNPHEFTGVSCIYIDGGNEAVISGNDILSSETGIIIKGAQNVTLTDNDIEVNKGEEFDGCAVEAYNAGGLKMSGNTINYTGASTGATYNKGLYIHGEIKSDVLVSANIFNLSIPSLATVWNENPPGSGNWESVNLSVGIDIVDEGTSNSKVTFSDNNITVKYNDVAGSYDSLYAVSIRKPSGIVNVSDNVLVENGNNYTYGFLVIAGSLTMDKNDITVISDGSYACGISISDYGYYNKFSYSVIKNNKINAKADNTVYGIYSEGNEYTGNGPEFTLNDMTLKADTCIGIDLVSNSAPSDGYYIGSNTIAAEGAYLSGIAVRVKGKCGIKDNKIEASAVESDTDSFPDYNSFNLKGVSGIYIDGSSEAVISGNDIYSTDSGIISYCVSSISSNIVKTEGDYAIDVDDSADKNTKATVTENKISAKSVYGNASVKHSDVDDVHDNIQGSYILTIKSYDDTKELETIMAKDEKDGYYAHLDVAKYGDYIFLKKANGGSDDVIDPVYSKDASGKIIDMCFRLTDNSTIYAVEPVYKDKTEVKPTPVSTASPTPTVTLAPTASPTPTQTPGEDDDITKDIPFAENVPVEEKTAVIEKTDTDKKDVVGSTQQHLYLRAAKVKNNSVKISWKKVKGADGYIIYGNKCGKKMKYITTIDKPSATSYIAKKLKKGTYYKYLVVAYKTTSSGDKVITTSKSVHAATTGGKVGNPTSIKVKKSKFVLKKGKKAKIKASFKKKKNVKLHISKFRYESLDKSVATVNKKGEIKAVSKGKTKIIVYTQNGLSKAVSVTVK